MIELVSTNVLLKGSQKRQINAFLRRALRLGQRVGDFVLTMTIARSGRHYEVKAQVQDQAGSFTCRSRNHQVMHACREVSHQLSLQLHNQRLRLAA